jgi:hypothetical protein
MLNKLKIRCGWTCLAYALKAQIEKGEYAQNQKQRDFLGKMLDYAREMENTAVPKTVLYSDDLFFYIRSLSYAEVTGVLLPIFKRMTNCMPMNMEDKPWFLSIDMGITLERQSIVSSTKHGFNRYEYTYIETDPRIALQLKRAILENSFVKKSTVSLHNLRRVESKKNQVSASFSSQEMFLKKPKFQEIWYALLESILRVYTFLSDYIVAIVVRPCAVKIIDSPDASSIQKEVCNRIINEKCIEKGVSNKQSLQKILDGIEYFTEILERHSVISLETVRLEDAMIISGHPEKAQQSAPSVYTQSELDDWIQAKGCRRGTLRQSDNKRHYDRVYADIYLGFSYLVDLSNQGSLDPETNEKIMNKIFNLLQKLDSREIEHNDFLRYVSYFFGPEPIFKKTWVCPYTRSELPEQVKITPLWDFIMPFLTTAYQFLRQQEGKISDQDRQIAFVSQQLETFREKYLDCMSVNTILKIGEEQTVQTALRQIQVALSSGSDKEKECLKTVLEPWQIKQLVAFMPTCVDKISSNVLFSNRNALLSLYNTQSQVSIEKEVLDEKEYAESQYLSALASGARDCRY